MGSFIHSGSESNHAMYCAALSSRKPPTAPAYSLKTSKHLVRPGNVLANQALRLAHWALTQFHAGWMTLVLIQFQA
jgi:hypothetical protein